MHAHTHTHSYTYFHLRYVHLAHTKHFCWCEELAPYVLKSLKKQSKRETAHHCDPIKTISQSTCWELRTTAPHQWLLLSVVIKSVCVRTCVCPSVPSGRSHGWSVCTGAASGWSSRRSEGEEVAPPPPARPRAARCLQPCSRRRRCCGSGQSGRLLSSPCSPNYEHRWAEPRTPSRPSKVKTV